MLDLPVIYQIFIFGGYFLILLLFVLLRGDASFVTNIVEFADRISKIDDLSSRKQFILKYSSSFIISPIIIVVLYLIYEFVFSIGKNDIYLKVTLMLILFTILLISIPVIVFTFLLLISSTCQRLHDIGYSAWWFGVVIVVGTVTEILSKYFQLGVIGIFVGLILILFSVGLFLIPSKLEGNKYRPQT